MKIKFILAAMLALGSLSYSAEVTDTVAQEVISEVRNIEAEYQALMQKEAERKEEFIQEKANLEKEDRRGNVKVDLNVGLESERYGVTASVGYDTKGENLRGGVGLRVKF